MRDAGVPHAAGAAFDDPAAAHAFIDDTFPADGPVPVIKADGLAAGKGVIVPCSIAEAHAAVDDLLGGRFGAASATVVVEERLAGLEASAMALVDGETVLPLPLSCDYKRALDGDRGLNTGGMGVYSPPGFLGPNAWGSLVESVHRPVARALQDQACPYRGLLYGGLMVDGSGAPRVIEFNCRFGDPETQVLAPQLRSDLLALLVACAEGRLETAQAEWSGEAAVGVVLASGGYPGAYETGHRIARPRRRRPRRARLPRRHGTGRRRRRRHQRRARAGRRGAGARSGDGAGAGHTLTPRASSSRGGTTAPTSRRGSCDSPTSPDCREG